MAKLITPDMALRDQQELNGMAVHEEGGLNDGSELEDEIVFNFPSYPSDVPDVTETMQEVASLESRLNDLLYLASDIEQAQGMNQAFALEAEKLLPGFGGVPIGYYTQEPSATRLKVSLEGLSAGIWALIGAATAAVIALIIKVFKYFTKKDVEADQESAVSAVDAKAEAAEVDADAIEKVDDVVSTANRLLDDAGIILKDEHGKEFPCTSFQSVIDHLFTDDERYGRAKRFLQSTDPLFHDIVNGGEYSKLTTEIGGKLAIANATLLAKMDMIDDTIRSDLNSSSQSAEMRNTRTLDKAEHPLEITVHNRTMTLSEAADHMKSLRTGMPAVHAHAVRFDQVFSAMARAYRTRSIKHLLKQLSASLVAAGTLEKRLQRMQEVSRNLSTDGTPGATTQEVGEHLRHVIFVAARDVAGLAMLSAEISHYAALLEHMAREAVGFAIEVVVKTTAAMRKNQQAIPKQWLEVERDLREQQKAITQAYYER